MRVKILNVACAARTIQKLLAVPRTAGEFLSLLVQRKKPKKARPGWRDISLRFSPESALAPTRRAQNTRLGLKHEARFSRFRLRCSGAPYGDENALEFRHAQINENF